MELIYPMFALVLLTLSVGLLTVYTRISAVRRGQMDARHFKTFSVGTPTDAVLKTGRHYNNLFELPLLFYAAGILAIITQTPGPWILCWAWLFVVIRVVHAFIHIGRNKIIPRMIAFILGWVAVLAMWIEIVVSLP